MERCQLIIVIGLAAALVHPSRAASSSGSDSINYQKAANTATWNWAEFRTSPLYCVSQCGDKYDIVMTSGHSNRYHLSFKILNGPKEVYAWQGHVHSVFRILGDRLYYADFHPSSCGGAVVCVNLSTGTQLWRSPLQAAGQIAHSAYRNLMNLDVSADAVSIWGNEGAGQYLEIKSIRTGQTLGHKVFSHG